MSNSNRPFGNNRSSDFHDPHQDVRTDASSSDADALDAWLNRIASHSGSSGTRSGHGHRRPNARIDDHDATGDTASIIETAARFHRRIEEAESRDARAAEPDPQLWGTIMERTSRPAPKSVSMAEATANPWVSQPDTRQSPPQRHERRSRPRIPNHQRIWNTVAKIGLVLAILLAGFGVWRLSGGPGLPSGSNDDVPTAPGFAMQASPPAESPATSEPAEVVVPPVATPAPTTDCDFSEDIPIFNGVDESPWDGTAVLLTTTGDLVLTCPEEPEPTELANGVSSVGPTGSPLAMIVRFVSEQPEDARVAVANLINGELVEFGSTEGKPIGTSGDARVPWVIGPAPGNTADVQILDLRTMKTRLLSDIAGVALPEHGGYLMAGNGDTALVLALQRHSHSTEGSATLVTSGLPGDVLVLDGSLDAASWVSAPDDFPPVVGFEVSPGGEHIALHGASGTMREREHTWSIISINDGDEIARSATVETGPEPADAIWTDEGFAYIVDNELRLIPTDPAITEHTAFEGDGPLINLRHTSEGSVVLVDELWSDDLATMVANDQTPTFHSIDVSTGETTTLTGIDVSANTYPWPYPHRFLVTFDYQLETPDTITYRVIDAVTGGIVGTIDDVPLNDTGYEGYPHLGLRSVGSSADGETEVIAFDTQHIYLMQVLNGESQLRQVASPPGVAGSHPMMASLFISDDGTLLSLTAEGDESQTRWLLPLDGDVDKWIEVPKTVVSEDPGYIFFVPGSGD